MKNATLYKTDEIVSRTNLEFHFDQVPKYWFGEDPFKTRFFDALGLSFPDGEKFFIQSVKAFRDKVTDPKLLTDISVFIKQEAQHGIIHNLMNENLKKQNIPVKRLMGVLKNSLNYNKSLELNLAVTVAYEYVTALLAQCLFEDRQVFAEADPRMQALWIWHSIEEMEHREVTFNVMKQVGNVDEEMRVIVFRKTFSLIFDSALGVANIMLRCDGFSNNERKLMLDKGKDWLFGPKGIMSTKMPLILDSLKEDFNPNHYPIIKHYNVWVKAIKETNDPIYAANKFWEAGLK